MALGSIGFSSSRSRSSSKDSVFLADLFEKLYGGASAAAAGIDTSGITEAANNLFTQSGGFLDSLSSAADPSVTEDQVASLKSDLDAFFNETLLPGITSDAASVGQLGGGRQGVAQGVAAGQVARALTSGIADIRERGANRQISAAQTGLQYAPTVFGFAQEASLAPLSPYLALSQVLGDPTVLNEASSSSKSKGFSLGFG